MDQLGPQVQPLVQLGQLGALAEVPVQPAAHQADGEVGPVLKDLADKASMLEFCNQELRCHNNYLDFEGFWEGRPPFDLSRLNGLRGPQPILLLSGRDVPQAAGPGGAVLQEDVA